MRAAAAAVVAGAVALSCRDLTLFLELVVVVVVVVLLLLSSGGVVGGMMSGSGGCGG